MLRDPKFFQIRPVFVIVVALAFGSRAHATDLVVSNATDVVNGTTTNPAALIASPGPDGISLREALIACNNSPGPHAISFAVLLNGQAINLTSRIVITRDGISIAGNLGVDGKPAITLNAPTPNVTPIVIELVASDFSLNRIRMAGIRQVFGLRIRAGAGGPQTVTNIRVAECEFVSGGADINNDAISVGFEEAAVAAKISGVTIIGNTFLRFAGDSDCIHVPATGAGCTIENLRIEGNRFEGSTYPVELVPSNGGTNNRILGTQIVRNIFVGNSQAISFYIGNSPGRPVTTANLIADTLIADNTSDNITDTIITQNFLTNNGFGITLSGGFSSTAGNSIVNTEISNNVISATKQGSAIGWAANGTDVVNNHIAGIAIMNDTIVDNPLLFPAVGGVVSGTGNTISGVKVSNTLLWNNSGGDVAGLSYLSDVSFCLTTDPTRAGINGNIGTDPKFVDAANRDYRLRAGSPAIDAGTSDSTPTTDFDGRPRFDVPATPNTGAGATKYFDIGAYEFAPLRTEGRLINLSVLSTLAVPGDTFTVGTVLGGSGTGGIKPLLVRAAGPSLGALGVPGTLVDPKLELFASSTKTGENDDWGGAAATSAAMAAVGGFAFTGPTSRDAAVATNVTSRDNSVKISAGAFAPTGTGAVIAEVYDATPAANFTTTTPRLINFSVLKSVGASVTLGFVIGGSTSEAVLVRAVGPSLGIAPFNLGGVMADPKVELFDAAGKSLATNDNWSGTTALTAAFSATGAFTLPSTSKDAALVTTLVPGNYSVVVTPVTGTASGTALLEVYEVP